MAMLFDVYSALDAGDNAGAVRLLAEVIQAEPSAQAWYLAARLTHDRDKAVRHLKRALLLDPKHADSLTLLRELDGERSITLTDVKEEVVETLEYEHRRLPVVRNLGKRQILVGALAAAVVLMGALVLLAQALRQPGPSLVPEQAPQAAAVTIVPLATVWQHFQNSGLPIQAMGRGATDGGRHTIELTIRDTAGQLVPVSVLVYDSIPALIADRGTLDTYEAAGHVLGAANTRLAYPVTLSGYLARQLENTLRSIPGV